MHHPIVRVFPGILLAFAAMSGCDRPSRPHPQGPGVNVPAAPVDQVPKVSTAYKDSQLTPEQRAVVLARIGDRTITLGELEARLGREPPVVRSQYASIQKRKDYLAKLVQFDVLAAEARRQGLDRDPEVVEQVEQAMVRRYLQDAVHDNVDPKAIPDADLRAYYDNNPGMYHRPEQREVSHMLFASEAKANQVANELRADSDGNTAKLVALWNDYVVRLSEDKTTAPYLGALGLVSLVEPTGATPQELERLFAVPRPVIEAAFAREPFAIGPVVQTPAGWHVLMVTSKRPPVERAYDDVKESIRARIVKRERDLRRKTLLDSLRAQAKVEINDDLVRLIPQATPSAPLGKAGDPAADDPSGDDSDPPAGPRP